MKSNEIISRRDTISKEITKYWGIIRAENLVEKSYKRNYDLKALLKKIEELKDLKRQSNTLYYIVLASTYVGSLILYLIIFNYLI